MKQAEVIMVRVYITEGDHQLRKLLDFLHNDEQVKGVTAFRGIAGFGRSGRAHEASLLDISMDLPLVVEFFDSPERVEKVLQDLNQWVEPGHVVSWPAQVNMGE
jgi:PII-like signaling protein